MKNRVSFILLTLKIYLLSLSVFSLFRLALYAVEHNRVGSASNIEIIQSFLIGLRFDIVIVSYIIILPFLFLSIYAAFGNVNKIIEKVSFYYIFTMFSIAFIVCSADIPYFSQFFSRFSCAAFAWLNTPGFVFKMIIQEPRYWGYTIIFVILNITFFLFLKKIFKSTNFSKSNLKLYFHLPITILITGLIFLGIRGRIDEKSPIRVGTAYFCNNSFLNQLGLNPNFTLINSYLELKKQKNYHYMDDGLAVKNLQGYFNINTPSPSYPIGRSRNSIESRKHPYNVVVVIMEGMSAYHLNNKDSETLVPFLDSISNVGYYFRNCYTAGIHTHNGIFSTLFSYPAIAGQHPMKSTSMKQYEGIASVLKKNDYSTIYFTTHDGQFDNVEGFLKNNQFETVISKKDYPSKAVKTTLGVPDDFMFEFSIPVLNNLYSKGKPFLSVFMTASNHGPFYLPDYFKPKSSEIKKQIVEYSDWSLKKFLNLSRNQPWFDSTLFVFIADHGAPIRTSYDISLDYLHTPLIIYAPSLIRKNIIIDKMASQIDVFPTIMGLLDINYENLTMGIDLLNETRPFAFFNAHEKYGVIDEEWLLILNGEGKTKLYKYKSIDQTDYCNDNPLIVNQMKEYLYSHLQAYQYLNGL